MTKTKLAFFIHDWFLEIGHSNATIETIRNFDHSKYEEICIIGFKIDNKEKLFPGTSNIRYINVPFKNIHPFILKSIFFQIYTFIYSYLFLREHFKVSVGISTLVSDLVIIQFIHKQWEKDFFSYRPLGLITTLYKKVLFAYFHFCESIVYGVKKTPLITVSNFLRDFAIDYYGYKKGDVTTLYSALNTKRFALNTNVYSDILKLHPELQNLNFNEHIFLFIGAYERKGLQLVLNQLEANIPNYQLIIVGKPESNETIKIPKNRRIVRISFSKHIEQFYSLADTFVFPTLYEPFGLVITEAALVGLNLIITEKNVGATEILHNIQGIEIHKDAKSFKISSCPQKLTFDIKKKRINERIEKLSKITWKNVASKMEKIISEI